MMTEARLDENGARKAAMAALAAARVEDLAAAWHEWAEKPGFAVVRGPETGLVMVRGRAGGGGAPFNLGETTVTRMTVRLDSGEVGHCYALGRDGDKARLAALFDALERTIVPTPARQVIRLPVHINDAAFAQAAADAFLEIMP